MFCGHQRSFIIPDEPAPAQESLDQPPAAGRDLQMEHHTQDRTETSYNDHGDVAREVTQSPQTNAASKLPDRTDSSEVLYSYEYDGKGNRTVKKTTSRTPPDGQPRNLSEVGRSIDY